MRKLILVVLFIFAPIIFVQAQDIKDTIRTDFSFWGNDYYLKGRKYSKGEIAKILITNPESKELISSYKLYKILTYITLTGGVLFTAQTLATIYIDENSYGNMSTSNLFYATAGCAIGFDLLTLFFLADFKYKFNLAVIAFNKGLKQNSTGYNSEFHLNMTMNRLILSYSF